MDNDPFLAVGIGLCAGCIPMLLFLLADHIKGHHMTPVKSDFDPLTGKLIAPKPPPPFVANPAALSPTGSSPGKLSPADGFRSLLTGLSLYGAAQALQHLLLFVGSSAGIFPKYGTEIAAVAVALAHLVMAWSSDNSPRPAEPHRVP